MNFAVIQFPGSNCDQDCIAAINGLDGLHAEYVWHKETSLDGFDLIVLPGGFSYGDYLRCGAIATPASSTRAAIAPCSATLVRSPWPAMTSERPFCEATKATAAACS